MVTISLLLVSNFDGAHKCSELIWNDPVEVTVLETLIILVIFDLELSEIVPVLAAAKVKALPAI